MRVKLHATFTTEQQNYLTKSVKGFYDELDNVSDHHAISDFQDWFTERTFLSLYINSQIRDSSLGRVSCIQEFNVRNPIIGGHGRCDAILSVDKSLYIIEAKCQKYFRRINEKHWCMKSWADYDFHIARQLEWYLDAEKEFYTDPNRYNKLFLQTMTFKVIEYGESDHLLNIDRHLQESGEMLNERAWYYACNFPDSIQPTKKKTIGIEIYGSISELTK